MRFLTVYVCKKADKKGTTFATVEALMIKCAKIFRQADGLRILSSVNRSTRAESVLCLNMYYMDESVL